MRVSAYWHQVAIGLIIISVSITALQRKMQARRTSINGVLG